MPQNYANHRRMHPLYHYFLWLIVILVLIGSLVYVWRALDSGVDLLGPILFLGIGVVLAVLGVLVRGYGTKLQDRAIRAEENLRHYVLAGKLLDPALSPKQIVALRFTCDEELPGLAQKAAETGMPPDEIKKSIKTWRPDYNRI